MFVCGAGGQWPGGTRALHLGRSCGFVTTIGQNSENARGASPFWEQGKVEAGNWQSRRS